MFYRYSDPKKVVIFGWSYLHPGRIEKRSTGTQEIYGQWRQLEQAQVIQFPPNRFTRLCHELVQERCFAYTPDCLGQLTTDDLEALHDHGFLVPISQLPEYHAMSSSKEVDRQSLWQM